jgi:hypothetical protein
MILFNVRPIGIFEKLTQNTGKLYDPPSTYDNVAWFQDSRSSHFSRCSRCPNLVTRCTTCTKRFDAEVFLVTGITLENQTKILKSLNSIPVKGITEALNMSGITANYEVLTQKRLYYLQNKYSCNFFFYIQIEGHTRVVYKPGKIREGKTIHLMLRENFPNTINGVIENFDIINKKILLPKQYICTKLAKCKYSTFDFSNFKRHELKCEIGNAQQIKTKQISYGKDTNIFRDMVDQKIVPEEAVNYRNFQMATFDIETIEEKIIGCEKNRGMNVKAKLKLLSIAVGSNIPNQSPKCWVRNSMETSEEKRLITLFIEELMRLQIEKLKYLPDWIEKGKEIIFQKKCLLKSQNARWTAFTPLFMFKKELEKLSRLDVFGFNCARFDLPCIAGPLFLTLQEKFEKVEVLKKNAAYISISTNILAFKDALKFTAPCSYDKFARVWEAPTFKSIWPYSFYSNIEEIKAAKKFPPLSAFKSTLKGDTKPDIQTYINGKREFYKMKLLPKSHKDRIVSMYGFLKFYNTQDVQPLVIAIENCFKCYDQYFGVNAMLALSLPSLAMKAMFKNYSKTDPLVFSIPEKNKEINRIFRSNVEGGLVNVYRRDVTTNDSDDLPHSAKYADNGDKFTFILGLDFNSMYLACQGEQLPTSPGILHEKLHNGYFYKQIMCSGHSLKCQQWLCYLQATG